MLLLNFKVQYILFTVNVDITKVNSFIRVLLECTTISGKYFTASGWVGGVMFQLFVVVVKVFLSLIVAFTLDDMPFI